MNAKCTHGLCSKQNVLLWWVRHILIFMPSTNFVHLAFCILSPQKIAKSRRNVNRKWALKRLKLFVGSKQKVKHARKHWAGAWREGCWSLIVDRWANVRSPSDWWSLNYVQATTTKTRRTAGSGALQLHTSKEQLNLKGHFRYAIIACALIGSPLRAQ